MNIEINDGKSVEEVSVEKLADRLAELKTIIKTLEDEAKGVQELLIAAGAPDKLKTQYGNLCKTTRVTVDCVDKDGLYRQLGHQEYILASTVAFGAVKKQFGEVRAEMLKASGLFRDGSTSVFYQLRK